MYLSLTYYTTLLLSVVVFWLIPERFHLAFLALVSIGYLLSVDSTIVVLSSVFLVAVFVLKALVRDKERWQSFALGATVVLALAYLGVSKYWQSAASQFSALTPSRVMIPLGLSYFTIRLIDYSFYSIRREVSTSWGQSLVYFYLFPAFPAGPVGRFSNFLSDRETGFRSELFLSGLNRILYGLIKKFVIIEFFLLTFVSDHEMRVFLSQLSSIPPSEIWTRLFIIHLVVYLDFSAYSDLAIGTSRLFGIKLPENFRHPLFATNLSDFWKRWHMSLTNITRHYVYQPLWAKFRNTSIAIVVTMLMIGLWHGITAGWFLWGLYQAGGLILYTAFHKSARDSRSFRFRPLLSWMLTMAFITSSKAFLVSPDPKDWTTGFRILARLMGY